LIELVDAKLAWPDIQDPDQSGRKTHYLCSRTGAVKGFLRLKPSW